MILQTSWLAHLPEINTADQANKNFGTFVDATAVEKPKMTRSTPLPRTPTASLLLPTTTIESSLSTTAKNSGALETTPP